MGGFWIINAKSREEAIAWAKRVPAPHPDDPGCEIEVRQFFEMEDFAPSPEVEKAKDLGKRLAATKSQGASSSKRKQ